MRRILLYVTGLSVLGCAHHPAPTNQIATSLAAVRGAEEAGAQEVPEAALHLKLAEEQIDEARKLMADGEHERAEGRALRADQDAELAVLLARRSATQQKLEAYTRKDASSGGQAPAAAPQQGGAQ